MFREISRPVHIILSILGILIGLIVLALLLCLIAYLMNIFGAGNNVFVDFMYKVMRFIHLVK